MEYREHCHALRREGHALGAAARQAGMGAPVPACPDWQIADLVGHVGRLHHYVVSTIESGGEDPTDGWAAAEPPAVDVRLDWFEQGVDLVSDALLRVDAASPAWSWTTDATAGFWARRQANETAVHRWDAQTANGATEPIEYGLAVDGVDEFFGLIPFWKGEASLQGAGESIHLHATDGEGEWFVRLAADRVIVTREHAKGDVALRASASDLLLFLYGRVDRSAGDVFGDESLLDRWQQLVQW
jgi:uncharacterized protein (TIGR03083 family)